MNRLYFVRHGENRANLTKEFSHRKVDYSLTPKGRLQAQQTAEFLLEKAVHEIYASPLKRAVETARIISRGLQLPFCVVEQFREVNVGCLEDLPPTRENWALHNQVIDAWWNGDNRARFPGGEDQINLWQRMRAGVEGIIDGKEGKNILIVIHGGILTFTLKDLCPQIDIAWLRNTDNHNCSISEIWVEKENGALIGKLQTWASYSHLHGKAADLVSGVP